MKSLRYASIPHGRVVCLLMLCAAFSANAQTWPIPDWAVKLTPPNEAITALETYAFPERDDATRLGVRTDALLVVRDGVRSGQQTGVGHEILEYPARGLGQSAGRMQVVAMNRSGWHCALVAGISASKTPTAQVNPAATST